jgi:hypothetical protein
MNSKKAFWFSLIVFLVIIGAGASDYLGPDRTRITYSNERKHCYYTVDTTHLGGYYGCHLNLYTTPDGACPSASSTTGYFTTSECSWPVNCASMDSCIPAGPTITIEGCSGSDQGCRSVAHTTVYPEATASGSISCSNPGANGWCAGSATLNISANEPVAGYNILDVEGTHNGLTFACVSSSCSVPLLEGDNNFSFWALSSWGDSSGIGSASGRVDTQPPLASGQLAGITGAGGWFVSSVDATVSASDATSGMGSIVYTLDGGSQTAYSGTVTIGDGSHSIVFYAMDRAGNSSSVSLNANVDATPPAIAVDAPGGTLGANGWFVSDATLSASATDGGSGLASLEYSLDGGAQTAYSVAIPLGNGAHTIVFTATDQAGNTVTASQTVNVDTTAPHLTLNAGNAFCPACNQRLGIDYSATDADSGIADWTLMADGITLANGFAAESGTFEWDGSGLGPGAHTITLQGRDLAGNTTQVQMTVTLAVPTPMPNGFIIPKQNLPVIIRPVNPAATPMATSTAQQGEGGQSTAIRTVTAPTTTRTNSIIVATANPTQGPNPSVLISNSTTPATSPINGALFGAEAAAVIGAATAYALEQKRKREEEEAQAAAAAAQFNNDQENLEKLRAMAAYYRPQFEELMKGASNIGISPEKLAEYQKLFDEGKFGEAINGLNGDIQSTIKTNLPDYEAAALHSEEAKGWLEKNVFPYYKPYQDDAHWKMYDYLPDAYREAALHSLEADKWITGNFTQIYQDELNKWAAKQLPGMISDARTLGTSPDKMYVYEGFAGNIPLFQLYQLIAANNAELYPIYLAEQIRKMNEQLVTLLPPEYRAAASHSPEAEQWITNNAHALWNAYQELLKQQAKLAAQLSSIPDTQTKPWWEYPVDWFKNAMINLGNSGPIGKAIVTDISKLVLSLTGAVDTVFHPTPNTSGKDRFWASVELVGFAFIAAYIGIEIFTGGAMTSAIITNIGEAIGIGGGATAAAGLCEADDCIQIAENALSTLNNNISGSPITWDDVAVIGKYIQGNPASYEQIGSGVGANIFNMDPIAYSQLSEVEKLAANQTFLDNIF